MKLPPEPWRPCEAPNCTCGLIWPAQLGAVSPATGPIIRILHHDEVDGRAYPPVQVLGLTRLVARAAETRRLLEDCHAGGTLPAPLARRVARHLWELDNG